MSDNHSGPAIEPENATARQPFSLPPRDVQIFTAVTMAIEFVAMVPVTLLIAYVVLARSELRKGVNFILLACLSCECLFILQWSVLQFYYNFVHQQGIVCGAAAYFELVASIVFVTSSAVLAYNRYLAIHDSVRFEDVFRPRNTALFILTSWLFAIACTAPLLPYMGFDEAYHCGVRMANMPEALQFYFRMAPFVGFACCAVTIIRCNVKISRKLAAHRKQMMRSNIRNEKLENGGFENIRKLLYFYVIFPLPILLPFNVLRAFPAYAQQNPWLSRIFFTFICAAECAVPYLLIYCLKPFRDAIREVLRGICCWRILGRLVCGSNNAVGPNKQAVDLALISTT